MKTYSQEFKAEAVKLSLSSDQPYSHTAKELGINPRNLYNWLKQSQSDNGLISTSNNKHQLTMETIQLRKELKRKDQELAILKKAAAYFAKHLK